MYDRYRHRVGRKIGGWDGTVERGMTLGTEQVRREATNSEILPGLSLWNCSVW